MVVARYVTIGVGDAKVVVAEHLEVGTGDVTKAIVFESVTVGTGDIKTLYCLSNTNVSVGVGDIRETKIISEAELVKMALEEVQ